MKLQDDPWAGLLPEAGRNVIPFERPSIGMDDLPTPPPEFMERWAASMANQAPDLDDAPDASAAPPLNPTAFVWRDPASIPPRPWVYGRHMIRKQVSVTVAPGGVGKSSLTILEAICLASGRQLLGEWVPTEGLRAWVYNLEDPRDEMDRRVIAAMMHHHVKPEEVEDRLFLDTGRERPLCTAMDIRGETMIVKPEIEALEAAIKARGIDVLIVDPFVSSHRVSENASGAIDLVAKEWARLADRCNCAIELVHHTRKTGGQEATTEDGRGSSALLGAARSGRVLNKMSDEMKEQAGIKDEKGTIFGIDRDKANLAPAGARQWVRMVSVDLGQGDQVGVPEVWEWPDAMAGFTSKDLLAVQNEIDKRCVAGNPPRFSDQTGDWAGHIVAEFLDMDAVDDKRRIKKILSDWIKSGALKKGEFIDARREKRPTVEVGEWAVE